MYRYIDTKDAMSKLIVGGVYKHYKGYVYKVLGAATHSETLEELVIYQPVNGGKGVKIWARPKGMFLEKVTVEGKKVPRFQLMSKK